MEDVKKRGRPAKSAVAELASESAAEVSGGTSTPPKKRGRPSNADKLQPAAAAAIRGRGRPPRTKQDFLAKSVKSPGSRKPIPPSAKMRVVSSSQESEDDEERNDAEHSVDDGDADETFGEERTTVEPKAKRGRPAGSGKVKAKKAKKPGRPRKVPVDSGEEADEASDDEELKEVPAPKPLGRPPTGGTSLNIVATGRGQGRPKKIKPAAPAASLNGTEPKRGRGRPPSGKSTSKWVPTGRPRGRPKATGSSAAAAAANEKKAKVVESESQEEVESQDDDDDIVEISNGKERKDESLEKEKKKTDDEEDDDEDDDRHSPSEDY